MTKKPTKMEMYETPVEGIYKCKTRLFDGSFREEQVRVLILGESAKRYRIKLKMPVANYPQFHEMSVCRHNVVKNGERPGRSQREYDYSNAHWQN